MAQNMRYIAEDELARHNCTKLTLLRVEIGSISGVMVDALEFGLQCLVKGTPHESAVPASALFPRVRIAAKCSAILS